MYYLKKFTQHSEYEAYISGGGALLPNVSICEKEGDVHYNPNDIIRFKILYKTDVDKYSDEVDYDDVFLYDGTIEISGETYHKWSKNEYSCWMITEGDDYSDSSLENPIEPVGYLYNDKDFPYDAKENDWIVLQGVKEYHKRDTSKLDDNGYSKVDLGLPTGTLWSTCNVGAETETEYGDYFMWGSTTPDTNNTCDWEHAPFNNGSSDFDETYFASVSGTVCPNGVLTLEHDAARAQMGGDWRMPTKEDYNELLTFTTNEWVEDYNGSGKNGRLFTSKTNGNTMFIPAAGYRHGSSFYGRGYYGSVWSSLLYTDNPNFAWRLFFYSDDCFMNNNSRCYGFSVRGIL